MSFSKLFSSLTAKATDSRRVVGIDIGSSSIKVVEIENRDDVLTLTTYGELQIGPYADLPIGQSVVLEAKKEQQALVDVIRESAVKAKNAVFAMPLASSFVTTIQLEASKDEDLTSRVRVEARKYIPVPINDVTLDWAEIKSEESAKKEKTLRDILMVAIQNDALTRFKVLMQFANLKEPPTEIECFSSLRAAFKPEEKNIALIDVGAVSTRLYLARGGLLQRMHRVRAGGALVTKKISEALQISFEEAESRKRSILTGDNYYRDMNKAHQAVYERSLMEFRQVIHEYEKKTGESIDSVYIAGNGVLFPAMKQAMADSLQREVQYVNPFAKVAYPAFMEDMITELGPTFHVALGAALRVFE
jgi:type IV pilus assembly protein PilM